MSDDATLGLMSEFDPQLNHATMKAEAIRQAQIALLREEVKIQNGQSIARNGNIPRPPRVQCSNKNFWHPDDWSGFTTIGMAVLGNW